MISLLGIVGAGCSAVADTAERPAALASWETLATAHNERVARVQRLWARAVVGLTWRDEEGDHRQQGEGHLVLRPPEAGALTVGKLGNVMAWAGFDADRYWLFDLREKKDATLFVGTRGVAPSRRRFPMPVRPDRLVALMGLARLDVAAGGEVGWSRGHYVLRPQGAAMVLRLDPASRRVSGVDLLGRGGGVGVTARLSDHERLETPGRSPGAWPYVAGRVEAEVVGEEAGLTISLHGLTADRDRVRDRVFDLEVLQGMFEPAQVIEMDGE